MDFQTEHRDVVRFVTTGRDSQYNLYRHCVHNLRRPLHFTGHSNAIGGDVYKKNSKRRKNSRPEQSHNAITLTLITEANTLIRQL